MNAKQLFLLLLLVLVLGGAGLMLRKNSSESWQSSAENTERVVSFPLNDALHITIKDSTGAADILKKNDVWTVQQREYPASFEQVSALLRKTWELKPVQDVKVGASQLGRLDLLQSGPGQGTLVDLRGDGGKSVASLLLGKKLMKKMEGGYEGGGDYPAGRYVMNNDGSNHVWLVSETLEEASADPAKWLDKTFIQVNSPRALALSGTSAAFQWKLSRDSDGANWQLADTVKAGESADTTKTGSLSYALSAPVFVDVLPASAKPEASGLDKPSTLSAETFDGFTYTLKVGAASSDRYPVTVGVTGAFALKRAAVKGEKAEDKTKADKDFETKLKGFQDKLAKEKKLEGRIYLVEKSVLDPLLKARDEFLNKPSPTPSPSPSPVAAPALSGSSANIPPAVSPAPASAPAPVVPPPPQPSPAPTAGAPIAAPTASAAKPAGTP